MNLAAINHIKKPKLTELYLHYLIYTFLLFLSIGFTIDSGFMALFAICSVSYWAFCTTVLSKKFNIIYLSCTFLIYEAFTGNMFGIGILSYIIATSILGITKKFHSIPMLRVFKKDQEIRYILLFCSYVIARDCLSTFISYVGFDIMTIMMQIAFGIALYHIFQLTVLHKTRKSGRFGRSISTYQRY